MEVRVRIAPSPTGIPHIGNTRTALYNYLFAKKNKGKFIVRIEDTDRQRLVPESLAKILEILNFLGLAWDEGPQKEGAFGPYIQSQRLTLYKKYAQDLVGKGQAYYCFCTKERLEELRKNQQKAKQLPKYDRLCLKLTPTEIKQKIKNGEKYVIRLKIPQKEKISWIDLVQGKVEFDTGVLDDQVLLKSDGFPTYHLAVVVDDNFMKITHVLRGAEWISSTPKHIILYRAFGWKLPQFGHLPIILGSDKTKLSKRHGACSVLDYRAMGYLPEALIDFMAYLGWSYKDNSELLTLEQLTQEFQIEKVRQANPIFDLEKLNWFNQQWLKKLDDQEFLQRAKPYLKNKIDEKFLMKIIPLVKERITKLTEVDSLLACFTKLPDYKKELFKGQKTKEQLMQIIALIKKMVPWKKDVIYAEFKKTCNEDQYQKKEFYTNLYVAIEGQSSGLPLFEAMEILGKNEVLSRLEKALGKL